jgi:hypothetical protein
MSPANRRREVPSMTPPPCAAAIAIALANEPVEVGLGE